MLKRTLSACLIFTLLLISSAYLTRAEELVAPLSLQPRSDPALVTLSLVVHPDGTWEGQARFSTAPTLAPSSSAQMQQEAAAIFEGHSARYALLERESGDTVFSLAGDDAREIVELALTASHAVKRLDGPLSLDVGGLVHAGQAVTLTLTSNPSTGYAWGMESLPGSALSQVNGVETRQIRLGLGVPARQIIRIKAAETGPANLRLLYRRPWQADLAPTVAISIQTDGLDMAAICSALSTPLPSAPPPGTLETELTPRQRASSAQSLPSAYDWCATHGGCTSVKNQGQCGSCWAFGTAGPLELLLNAAGQANDLSEQYLVSCNESGYNCGGGWFAHGYHQNIAPPSETQAGAVLESAFPYVALDVPCAGPYNHPHKIASWHYVDGYSVPSVDAIKQAIYDHGPVAVALCVNSEFQDYDGGIFNPSTTCGSINHAVVLVGWNDAEQTWILRNSWGSGWGESGYMRIRYGTSNVGYATNYVVYNAPFTATDWVYLPLTSRNFGNHDSLVNGDFENGRDGSWTESSSNGWALITSESSLPVSPHGGSWAAWLGGDENETAILSQQITVPSDAATLDYWYWIGSEDLCGYDYARVNFDSTTAQTYNLCESNNTGGWVSQQVDVTNWRGQTVELNFGIETDSILNSNFFLDDVTFSTATSHPPFSISPAPAMNSATDATIPKRSR